MRIQGGDTVRIKPTPTSNNPWDRWSGMELTAKIIEVDATSNCHLVSDVSDSWPPIPPGTHQGDLMVLTDIVYPMDCGEHEAGLIHHDTRQEWVCPFCIG